MWQQWTTRCAANDGGGSGRQATEVKVARDGVEGASNGHDHDPSVAAEDNVLMTLGRQDLHARVGQGPCAPKAECRVPTIDSGLVEVRGEAVPAGPRHLQ